MRLVWPKALAVALLLLAGVNASGQNTRSSTSAQADTARASLADSVWRAQTLPALTITDTRITPSVPYRKTQWSHNHNAPGTHGSLAQMVSDISSVYIRSYGQGGLATMSFRGTGAGHTQVYWNGIPINSPNLGLSDLAEFPMSLSSNLELHHGLSSLVDGSGGLGGSIQLNQHHNWRMQRGYLVSQRVSSFGDYRTLAQAHVVERNWLSETTVYHNTSQNDFTFTNVAREGQPTERQIHAAVRQYGVGQELARRAGKHTFTLRGHYAVTDRELPRLITATASEQTQLDRAARGMGEWFWNGHHRQLRVRTALTHHWLNYRDGIAGIDNTYIENAWYSRARYRQRVSNKLLTTVTLESGIVGSNSDGIGRTVRRNQFAVVAKADWKPWQRLLVHSLARQELIDGTVQPTLPSIGARYRFAGKSWFVKSNWSRSYRVPTLNDLYWAQGGNPNLETEQGWSGELGLLHCHLSEQDANEGLTRGNLRFESTAFYSRISNWIQWVPQSGSNLWMATNYQEIENYGLESTLRLPTIQLDSNWMVTAQVNHTYTQSILLETVDADENLAGRQLIYVPPHQLNGSITLQAHSYRIRYRHTYTDRVFITTDNQWFLPNYDLANLSITRSIEKAGQQSPRWTLRFEINNLYNKQYQALPWRPMPGRWYSFSIRYRWRTRDI